MNITKQKQTHRYRGQISGYQQGDKRDDGDGLYRGKRFKKECYYEIM